MRPIRTIVPLAIGLLTLGVAGCQRPSDPTTTATPTPTSVEQATPGTTPNRHPMPPPNPAPKANPAPDPGLETVVGLWPVKTLAQARELQDSVDAGHQPWLLSAEQVSVAYAQGELHLFAPPPSGWDRASTRSAPTTASGRPPCTWPSRCVTTTACGS